jgi:NitT/TauT family transport system permease protein
MKKFFFLLPIIGILLLWEIVSRKLITHPAIFPPPTVVALSLWELTKTGTLFSDLKISLLRLFFGFLIGGMIGIGLGLITGRIKWINATFTPVIQVLRSLPPVALLPLIIVWFGIDDGAKIFSIALAVFFPIWLNTHLGVERVPREFLWSAKLLRRKYSELMPEVVLPSALPLIIAGIRTSIAMGYIMVFVSELMGASAGLGYRIEASSQAYRMDQMMAALAMLGFLGALTDWLFVKTIGRFCPWLKI